MGKQHITKPCNEDTDPYVLLCNAIIEQACLDYMKEYAMGHENNLGGLKRFFNRETDMGSLIFNSFDVFDKFSGDDICRALEYRVDEKRREKKKGQKKKTVR